MNREQCLRAALDAVDNRPVAYGAPEQNFDRIAALWNIHLANTGFVLVDMEDEIGRFNATDVAIFMALVKIARLAESPDHVDSWVDLAGYAACGAEVSTEQDPSEGADYYQYGGCDCPICRSS
jgi:hypothetical protein